MGGVPMSMSGCFFGTKEPPWLAEQSCSLSPGDTVNPEELNILKHIWWWGLYKEQLCASGISGHSPHRVLRGRMPEVWLHCLL